MMPSFAYMVPLPRSPRRPTVKPYIVRAKWLLPRVSLRSVDGIDHYVLSDGVREVSTRRTPGLDLALSGVRMGDAVVDTSNAQNILNQLQTMQQQAQAAQAFVQANAASPGAASSSAFQSLQADLNNWNTEWNNLQSDVQAIQTAAQNALSFQTPQSITDTQNSELADLASGAATLASEQQQAQSQIQSTPAAGGGTTGGGATLPGGQVTISPGGLLPGTSATTTTTTSISPITPMFLGLPWYAWLIGGGGLLLLFALMSGGKGGGGRPVVYGGR